MGPKYSPFDLSTPALNGKLNIHENLMARKLVPSYVSDCEMAPGSKFQQQAEVCGCAGPDPKYLSLQSVISLQVSLQPSPDVLTGYLQDAAQERYFKISTIWRVLYLS